MSRILKTIRAITTVTLIVGSVFVQHVARAQQLGNKQGDLQFTSGMASEAVSYIMENGKPLLILVR